MKNKTKIRIIKDKANKIVIHFLTNHSLLQSLLSNKYLDYIEIDDKNRNKKFG